MAARDALRAHSEPSRDDAGLFKRQAGNSERDFSTANCSRSPTGPDETACSPSGVDERGIAVRRADEAREDPAIRSFLALLVRDIERHPENLKAPRT